MLKKNNDSLDQLRKLQLSREASLSRLLFWARKAFVQYVYDEVKTRMPNELTKTQLDLLPYIKIEGSKVTSIAREQGISKQAVSRSLHALEALELVTFRKSAEDRRLSKVYFSDRGLSMLSVIHNAVLKAETRVNEIIGVEEVAISKQIVGRIPEVLNSAKQRC